MAPRENGASHAWSVRVLQFLPLCTGRVYYVWPGARRGLYGVGATGSKARVRASHTIVVWEVQVTRAYSYLSYVHVYVHVSSTRVHVYVHVYVLEYTRATPPAPHAATQLALSARAPAHALARTVAALLRETGRRGGGAHVRCME